MLERWFICLHFHIEIINISWIKERNFTFWRLSGKFAPDKQGSLGNKITYLFFSAWAFLTRK